MRLPSDKRFSDLHHLPVRKRKLDTAFCGMHIEMNFLQLFRRGGVHAHLGDEPKLEEFLLAAQKNILRNCQSRQDRLFLKDHGDAGVESVARRDDSDRLAIDVYPAGIWADRCR